MTMNIAQAFLFAQSAVRPTASPGVLPKLVEMVIFILIMRWAAMKIMKMQPERGKKYAIATTAIGFLCFVLCYLEYSSIKSQLQRARGVYDSSSLGIVIGIIVSAFGAYAFFVHNKSTDIPENQKNSDLNNKIGMTPSQRLSRLNELKDASMISEEEYQERRKKILDTL